ncbi:FAD binding domain-containing protein [Roseivivax sp. CAU 1761]
MTYLAPTRLEDALAALEGGAAIVAGGTDWFPGRGIRPFRGALLDVTRIEGLRGIARDGDGWRIGAATTWTDILRADLPPAFDGLKAAAREVGSVQIQNAGTVAGNLCNASPAADGVPPLLTLDAEVELTGRGGARRLPLEHFLTGVRQTARAPDELVTALRLPALPAGAGSGFVKLGARRYLVISICMAAALVPLRAGRIQGARIAVGACSPVALRLSDLEAALEGARPDEAAERITPDLLARLSPIDDIRGSAAYRREAGATAIARALDQACQGAR